MDSEGVALHINRMLRQDVLNLTAQLESMRKKYDRVLKQKEDAEQRYRKDYEKWREFKEWILHLQQNDTLNNLDAQTSKILALEHNTDEENQPGDEAQSPSSTRAPVITNRHISRAEIKPYSTFKGRGRYSTTLQNDSINARFKVSSAHNNGQTFQYDEVVRKKGDRKHLNGTDCECCREYYQAVGPLPTSSRGPLWRSPPQTPRRRNDQVPLEEGFESEVVAAHKQEISRHRQKWELPKTPPGYWDIGFPDTQETGRINDEAQRMHREKKAGIEAEAEQGGRYQVR